MSEPCPPALQAALERKFPSLPDPRTPSFAQLYPYQQEAVRFGVARERVLLADEMGLGKTFQALALLDHWAPRRVLIVCPSSLVANWVEEHRKLLRSELSVIRSFRDLDRPLERHVMSYGLLSSKNFRPFREIDALVLDESHYVKKRTSKRAQRALVLAKRARFVILMSGTPHSRSEELYQQLRILDPVTFRHFYPYQGRALVKNVFYFGARYCAPRKVFIGPGRFEFQFPGNTRPAELHRLLRKFMIRRLKSEVLELPPKMRHTFTLARTTRQLNRIKSLTKLKLKDGQLRAHSLMTQLVLQTSRTKRALVCDYLGTLPETEPVLVFAHHHDMLDAIRAATTRPSVAIDGRTPAAKRQALVDRFQDGEVDVAVLGIESAGTGLNLFRASTVIFAELVWNHKSMLQAEDRAHRIGQRSSVTVRYLVLRGSTDDLMWTSFSAKLVSVGRVLDGSRHSRNSSVLVEAVLPEEGE